MNISLTSTTIILGKKEHWFCIRNVRNSAVAILSGKRTQSHMKIKWQSSSMARKLSKNIEEQETSVEKRYLEKLNFIGSTVFIANSC